MLGFQRAVLPVQAITDAPPNIQIVGIRNLQEAQHSFFD
jgi:hypothetical protein